MTIRTQLRVFLTGVVAVPLICAAAATVRHYATRPERILLGGYEQVRELARLPMSGRDIEVLKRVLRTLPPNVEFMLLADRRDVLLTTFPEFAGRTEIDGDELLRYMRETSRTYFYQLVSPPLKDAEVTLVSRVGRDEFREKRRGGETAALILIASLAAFEAVAVAAVVSISRTISRSLTLLEKSAERVAGGELDVPLASGSAGKPNEITRLADNLEKMRLALKDGEERRAKLIMGISHDLRTPVAVIKGYTEALSDGMCGSADEMQKSLGIIASKTEQLEAMVNTLINFVRLNRTDWRGMLRERPLAPLLREFAESAVTTGGVFRRNVVADVDVGGGVSLPFDPLLIQRALENIFSNAIRYSSDGDTIRISARETGGGAEIRISDTGVGIEEKDLGRIFDIFYRGTNSRREGGMGVGLSVVKTIMDTHGWGISVSSEPGAGTEFVITARKPS